MEIEWKKAGIVSPEEFLGYIIIPVSFMNVKVYLEVPRYATYIFILRENFQKSYSKKNAVLCFVLHDFYKKYMLSLICILQF